MKQKWLQSIETVFFVSIYIDRYIYIYRSTSIPPMENQLGSNQLLLLLLLSNMNQSLRVVPRAPPAASGSEWTSAHLEYFNMEVTSEERPPRADDWIFEANDFVLTAGDFICLEINCSDLFSNAYSRGSSCWKILSRGVRSIYRSVSGDAEDEPHVGSDWSKCSRLAFLPVPYSNYFENGI